MSWFSDLGEGMQVSASTLPNWFRGIGKIVLWTAFGTLVVATIGELTYRIISDALSVTAEDLRAAERKAEYKRLRAAAENAWRLDHARVSAQEEIEAAKAEANRLSLGLPVKKTPQPTDTIASFVEILSRNIWLITVIMLGIIGASMASAYQSMMANRARRQNIQSVEQSLRDNPGRPQLAWDLARTKLESYLDRNLSQVRSIYVLTVLVMIVGFSIVMYGLFQVSQSQEKLSVSIVASASGVLISFIGGSFLLIYKSILSQSTGYVTVLERINAVGMAVQVIFSIPEETVDLQSKTKAELAKQLLSLYATPSTPGSSPSPSEA